MAGPPADRGIIDGAVRSAAGDPVSEAVVAIGGDSPRHPDIAALTDAGGRYRLSGLTPGRYTVIARAEAFGVAVAAVAVVAGEVARLDLVLRPE
jgi:hypothetical protein